MSALPVIREKQLGASGARGNPFAVFQHADFWLVFAVVSLTAIGIVTLKGAVGSVPSLEGLAGKQLVFFWVAITAMIFSFLVDYRWINRVAIFGYWLNVLALVAVLLVGTKINGAQRWINFGPINYQPSETMKIFTVLLCGQWLALNLDRLQEWRGLAVPAAICGLPAALTVLQPDLGTSLLFVGMFFAMCFVAGASQKKLFLLIGAAMAAAVGAIPFLKPYQVARLLVFLDPEHDPLGQSFNVIQSRIAIGSGQFWGNGWGEGTQAAYRFLPEHYTDFIFASYVEQFGFVGGMLLLLLYLLLIVRMVAVMDSAKDRFGGIIVAGFIAVMVLHIVENVGMNMGLLPVTGMPLPLLSYGGSFLVTTYVMLGITLNVGSRRFTFTS